MSNNKEGRRLEFHIFRYDPQAEGDKPRMQKFEVREIPQMTVFIALNEIREKLDRSLQFDFVCRAGICGSCAMIINGKPSLACRTLTSTFKKPKITLMPLPGFELIGDLSVNSGKFNRALSERVRTWVHRNGDRMEPPPLNFLEETMDPDLADEIYELDRCIECGCCIAGCGTKRMRPDFLGAMGFIKIARFRLDPRDKRSETEWYEIVGNDEGVFGCMSLLGCEDFCPKDLPHQTKIAELRRKMIGVALTKK